MQCGTQTRKMPDPVFPSFSKRIANIVEETNFVSAGTAARFMPIQLARNFCSTGQRKKHTSRFFSKLTLDHGLSGSYCTMRPLVLQAVMRLAWEG